MNKIIFKPLFLIALSAVFFSGCKKQLEILPRQSIDASTALSTRDGIEASIVSIYVRLKNARLYGRDFISHPEALADNGFATNKSGRLLPEANNTFGAQFTSTVWVVGYQAINQINLTLEAIPTLNVAPSVTQTERDRWEGQLYFLRAMYYFDLMRVYAYTPGAIVASQNRGGVPLSLKGFSDAATALAYLPSRAPIDQVYTQIVADLVIANSKLLNPGLGVNLANKAAAQGLLAKVHLYGKNYTEAKRWADSCINLAGSRLSTAAAYVGEWRKEAHAESLFQLRFSTNAENIGVNESLQTSFTTLVTPGNTAGTGGFGDLVPTLTLLTDLGITLTGGNTYTNFSSFNAAVATRSTDVRNLLYEPGTTGRGKSYVECTKYIGKNGFINLDNISVLRISEIYLIRAEAMATAGSPVINSAAALADLKRIKLNRYTGYTGSAVETADNGLTDSPLYEEILKQRRLELAFEGNRFFDLKRLGRDLVKGQPYSNVAFTDVRILPAILQADVDGNPNLQQNFGY